MAKKRKRDRRQQQQAGDSTGASITAKESNDAEPSLSTKPTAADTAAPAAAATTSHAVTQPCRERSRLYTSAITYQCATQNVCIPCAYKICTFDVALDTVFTKMVPNARPESCPRSATTSPSECGQDGTMGYQRGMSVLTVGDGDLTFSLAVARILFAAPRNQQEQQHRNCSRLVATSYESRDTLLNVYPNIGETIQELESLGATVCYQVDATNIAGTLPEDVLKSTSSKKFNRITWNFPCSAIGSGQDGQNDAMEFNKQLIRDFVCNSIASKLLDKKDGEIDMLHKTKPPFNQWKIESVALEGLDAECKGTKDELEYKGRIAFDRCLMPPYVPRKALDKKSFTCHDACTYVLGWKGERGKRFGCTIPIPLEDGKNEGAGQEDGRGPEPLMVVTEDMIAKIRQIHLDAKMVKMAAAAAGGRGGKGGGGKKKRRRK